MDREWEQAARTGDAAALVRLRAVNIDVDARDRYGQTALMLAAVRGHLDAVRLLVDWGADLDVTAKYRLSALMLAILNHHAGVARVLIEAGADLSLQGSGAPGFAGRTARDLAAERGLESLFPDASP